MLGTEATIARSARPAAPSRRFLRLVRPWRTDRLASPTTEPTSFAFNFGNEPTADFAPRDALAAGSDRFASGLVVELVPPLQARLRAAAGLLFLMLGLLFVRNLLLPACDVPLRVIHAGALVGLGIGLMCLSHRWVPSHRVLRGIELAVFGLAVAFFATAQYRLMLLRLQQDDPAWALVAMKGGVLAACAVMAIYGLFIPNGWRRAVLVVTPMALMPLAVVLMLLPRHPALGTVVGRAANVEQASDDALMLLFSAIASIVGTHRRGGCRAEGAEACSLGPYQLRERIGTGGMGEVYLAEHQLLKRLCAIKLIHPGRAAEPQVLARFEREVRATARLSHPNTIEIYDYGRTEDGTLYYVMEYLPGLNLAELVERYGPLPPGRAIHLLRQACQALLEAHAEGLIHRDIKPANIFAAYRGGRYDVAKLLDFGLVKPLPGIQEAPVQVSQDHVITGSPLYMSPEQVLGDPTDPRSDLYSLGAVAYFLLTGQPPFPGVNVVRVMLAHAHNAVPPLTRHRPDVPADLEGVILRCLAKNPADRFPDAACLERALAACADADRWTPLHATQWWRDARPEPDASDDR